MELPAHLNNAVALLKRFDKAKTRKAMWHDILQDAYDFAAPQLEILNQFSPGQQKNTEIFDSTAVIGVPLFASAMQKAVAPAWQEFIILETGSEIDSKEKVSFNGKEMTIEEALSETTKIVFQYIHRSNFITMSQAAFVDFAISTGVMTVEFDADADELINDAIPLGQVSFEQGPRGVLKTMWREQKIEVRLVEQIWPDAKIPPKVKTAQEKSPEQEMTFVEGFIFDPKTKLTFYTVISKADKAIIFVQDDEVSPVVAFRGMVVPGEIYGRGPIMQVLPDIKTLNMIKEFELTSGAIAASGAWTGVDDGAFNPYTVTIAPGVVIPVQSNDGTNPTLRALDMNFDFNWMQIKSEELTNVINRVLFVNPLGTLDNSVRTATEMSFRRMMDLQDQSGFFSRVLTEFVDQYMRRVVFVLQREGKIPQFKIDGKEVKIKHTSPIARAMDLEDAQVIVQAIQMAGVVGPEMMALGIKVEEVPGYIAEKLGVDPKLRRNDTEKQQLVELTAKFLARLQAAQAPQADNSNQELEQVA